ncbi:MAG: hypothetical protein KGJ80_04440 [Chloroflexota bacterium]|nr:hypothetical protein [Chloroflexota bacterium]
MIDDTFERGASPYWVRFATGHADIEHAPGALRFVEEGAEEGKLSDAEIGDYRAVPHSGLPWSPPTRMTVRARFSQSAGELLGTAGFGFWNDPFDWVGKVQSPPNALWFFYASPQSDMAFAPNVRGSGWKAAMLNSGSADKLTMALGNFIFGLPGMSGLVFRLAQTRIAAHEKVLDDVSLLDWHTYRIDWLRREAIFSVDEVVVLRAPSPPAVPLGFVAWIDNNCATMGPGREFSFTRLPVPPRQWMELSRVEIERLSAT